MRKKFFAVILTVVILIIAIPTVIAALGTYEVTIPAVVILNPSPTPTATPTPTLTPAVVNIEICDLNGDPLTKLDLGACEALTAGVHFMVKNTGNVPVAVTLTGLWDEPISNQTLPGEGVGAHGDWWHWDSQGNIIPAGGSMISTLSYHYDMVVSGYNVENTVNFKFIATEVQLP